MDYIWSEPFLRSKQVQIQFMVASEKRPQRISPCIWGRTEQTEHAKIMQQTFHPKTTPCQSQGQLLIGLSNDMLLIIRKMTKESRSAFGLPNPPALAPPLKMIFLKGSSQITNLSTRLYRVFHFPYIVLVVEGFGLYNTLKFKYLHTLSDSYSFLLQTWLN